MRLLLRLQREIACLHFYDTTVSNRQIADTVGVAPNTVRSLRRALLQCGQPWSYLQSLDDDAWVATVGTTDKSIAKRKSAPDWEWVHTEMQRQDATLEQLWQEWREEYPNGIQYSQFTNGYRIWQKRQNIVFRRVHRPGEKLYVDFAGRTVEIVDPNGGPSWSAQIFLAVLGYSNYTYIQAVKTQNTADWINCHINCFEALGGAPGWVVSDNLKAAVWRREKDRIVINPAYRDCLRHYNTAPLPTGVRKPKHKSKVEVGVQIAQRWILFALRDRVFFSLEELNEELRRRTEILNAHPFKKLPGCRRDRYVQGDMPVLKPLPAKPYELADWRHGIRVGDDYHVAHEGRYYSVPHQYAGTRIDYRFTGTTIEIFLRGRRLAVHPLIANVGDTSTLAEHRPITHRRVLEGEPKVLLEWSLSVGSNTHALIRHHLENRNDLTNGLKTARRLRDLARTYGDTRLEEVCSYALPLNITALRSITSILQKAADKRPRLTTPSPTRPVGEIRGASYYGETI